MLLNSVFRPLLIASAIALAAPAMAQDAAPAPQAPNANDMQAALQELAGMGIRCASMYQQLAVSADDGGLEAAGFSAPQAAAYSGQKDFWRGFLLFLTDSTAEDLDAILAQGSVGFAEFINGLADTELEDRDALRMQLTGFMSQCAQVRTNVVEPLLAAQQPPAPAE